MAIFFQSSAEQQAQALAKRQALGTGPTAAQSQLAQSLSQTQGMMSAQAAGVRQNPLAAMRSAQQQGAQVAAQGQMQAAQLRAQEQLSGQQMYMQQAQRTTEAQNGLANGLMAMGSTALAAGVTSDIRSKEHIQDGGQRTDELLRAMSPQQFQYRDQAAHGSGPRLGVMAQDVQRAAPELVDRGPDGNLRLDGPGALSASLAANARLAERLDALEGRMGGGAPRSRPAAPPPVEHKGKFDAAPAPIPEAPGGSRTMEEARMRANTQEAQDQLRSMPPEMQRARRDAEDWELQRALSASRTSPIPPSARRQAHRGPGVDMSSAVIPGARR